MNLIKAVKKLPKGTILYSPIYGDVRLEGIDNNCIIVNANTTVYFTNEGKCSPQGECMLFPSKNNKDWNTLINIYNGGNIIIFNYEDTTYYGVYKGGDNDELKTYCSIDKLQNYIFHERVYRNVTRSRLANSTEIEDFFKKLKCNRFIWDSQNKILKTIFKPFDKVLVRNSTTTLWRASMFSHYDSTSTSPYVCVSGGFRQCIPYEGNEYLIGTTTSV